MLFDALRTDRYARLPRLYVQDTDTVLPARAVQRPVMPMTNLFLSDRVGRCAALSADPVPVPLSRAHLVGDLGEHVGRSLVLPATPGRARRDATSRASAAASPR